MTKDDVIKNINRVQGLSKSAKEAINEIKKIAMDEVYHLDKHTRQTIRELKIEFNSTKVIVSKQRVNHEKIMEVVKAQFGVDFTKKTRKFQYKEARQVACYLFRKYTVKNSKATIAGIPKENIKEFFEELEIISSVSLIDLSSNAIVF